VASRYAVGLPGTTFKSSRFVRTRLEAARATIFNFTKGIDHEPYATDFCTVMLMLIGAIPTWPHSKNCGYGRSGGLVRS
jgi:hypothetical protein